jgi:hypothetical protein
MLAPAWIASKVNSENPLQIKDLHHRDAFVTAHLPRQPLIGAAVEFSPRAGIGFARD